MQTQQFRIILLFVMIIGMGIILLNHYFVHTSRNSIKQNMVGEMQILASQIMNYYNTPRRFQGGGLVIQDNDIKLITDFIKLEKVMITDETISTFSTEIALYFLSIQDSSIKIRGVSHDKKDKNAIQITMYISPSQPEPIVINEIQ